MPPVGLWQRFVFARLKGLWRAEFGALRRGPLGGPSCEPGRSDCHRSSPGLHELVVGDSLCKQGLDEDHDFAWAASANAIAWQAGCLRPPRADFALRSLHLSRRLERPKTETVVAVVGVSGDSGSQRAEKAQATA